MLLKCSECSETWNEAINFFSPLWHPPTLDILPGCWPRQHVLTLVKVSKNTPMNFPYHTESVSRHVDHFKQFFLKKMSTKNKLFSTNSIFSTWFIQLTLIILVWMIWFETTWSNQLYLFNLILRHIIIFNLGLGDPSQLLF